jgi:hypothetical protein
LLQALLFIPIYGFFQQGLDCADESERGNDNFFSILNKSDPPALFYVLFPIRRLLIALKKELFQVNLLIIGFENK